MVFVRLKWPATGLGEGCSTSPYCIQRIIIITSSFQLRRAMFTDFIYTLTDGSIFCL